MACIQRHSITLRKRDVLMCRQRIYSRKCMSRSVELLTIRIPSFFVELSEAQQYSVLAFNSSPSSFKRLIVLHLTSKWVIWIHMSKNPISICYLSLIPFLLLQNLCKNGQWHFEGEYVFSLPESSQRFPWRCLLLFMFEQTLKKLLSAIKNSTSLVNRTVLSFVCIKCFTLWHNVNSEVYYIFTSIIWEWERIYPLTWVTYFFLQCRCLHNPRESPKKLFYCLSNSSYWKLL